MATIGWIGLGHMGIPMSSNMLKAGYTVRGFDIHLLALRRAKAAGIQTVNSIRDAVSGAVAVFTMLPAGPDVDQVLTSHDGVFAKLTAPPLVSSTQRRSTTLHAKSMLPLSKLLFQGRARETGPVGKIANRPITAIEMSAMLRRCGKFSAI